MIHTSPHPVLLAGCARLFDYAGLFPPARLSLPDTAQEYVEHCRGPQAWLVRSVVLPTAQLDAFVAAAGQSLAPEHARLSILASDLEQEAAMISSFARLHPQWTVVSVETRWQEGWGKLPPPCDFPLYVELPWDDAQISRLDALAAGDAAAKIRMGGLESASFPSKDQVARFLTLAAERDVPFKATAGLHHPFAGERPACDAADAPRVPMHGFFSLLLAVAASRGATCSQTLIAEILGADAADIRVDQQGLSLINGERRFQLEELQQVRHQALHSIGSCSIDEPWSALNQLRW